MQKALLYVMELLDEELFFLILRFLQDGPCKKAAEALKEEVAKYQLLPKRIDWEGNNYPRQYEELVSTHPHIATDHLKRIVSRLPSLLEDKYPPNVRGVLSLLGAGNQSLLRSEKTADVLLKPSGYLFSQHDELLPLPNSLQHPPHMLRWLQGSEYTGIRRKINTPADMFNNYQLHRRFVGHLSSVYCVLYDRTGRYIFTGCDDHLVKIWSAVSGRLLASLRGHSQEIGDFAVNYENTMLASGSCDKTVRIWCLKTTECLAVLQGHSSTVTSLNFCPLVKGERRYLVSTSEDATVCFWHYEKSTNCFAQRPLKFVERSRTGARMLCSSFSQGGMFLATGSTDSVIRIYSFPALQPEKIAELEAHSAEVDSIRYSNSSERFISGSKDGTARIWRNVKNSWFSLSLSMKPLSGESSRSEQRSSSALRVNMVEWTVDDKLVLTAVSDFSVRVWCSVSGNQIRALSGHMDDVFVIECTALHSHLVVTAGHDGHLKLWNLATGKVLMDYYNNMEGQGFAAIFDCKWSPQGDSFTATDSHGHILRFGVGVNENLSENKIPTELFFHTDYRAVIRDINGHVLDELTQQPLHLLSPPFLIDINGIPYEPSFQRLVPGRKYLPEAYLIPIVNSQPDGERVVVDQDIPQTLNHAVSSQLSSDVMPVQRSSNQDSSNSNTQSAGTPQCYIKNVVPKLTNDVIEQLESERQHLAELEEAQLISDRKQLSFYTGEQTSSSLRAGHMRTRRGRAGTSRPGDSGRETGEQVIRNRLAARALYDTDVESEAGQSSSPPSGESSTDEEPEVRPVRARRGVTHNGMQSDGGSYVDLTSASESGDSSSNYSDWEVQNKTVLQPPSRVSRRKSRSKKGGIVSNSVTLTTGEESTEESDAESRRGQLPLPENTKELEDCFNPDWLTTDSPQKSPYFPQMGDEVMYFYRGHKSYVDRVRNIRLYDPKNLPWEKVSTLREQELARIVYVRYESVPKYPLVKLCCAKLAVLFPDGRKQTGTTFIVRYHDMPNIHDFLVLRQFYDKSMVRQWLAGDKFRTIFDGKWYSGRVVSLEPEDPDNGSPFLSYQVEWEDGSRDYLSPWDLEPLADDQGDEPLIGAEMCEEEKASLRYVPNPSDWDGCDAQEACQRICRCIEQLMDHSVSDDFNAPVDLNLYPNYAEEVAYGMDLSTIKSRLTNSFYRRKTAVQFDVRGIERNARTFNCPNSDIVKKACIVTNVCLQIISDKRCVDAIAVYNQLNLSDEYCTSSSSKSYKKLRKKTKGFRWQEQAMRIVEEAVADDDSIHFRAPPDLSQLPGYNLAVNIPMDFTTIKENLQEKEYSNADEFIDDVRLIICNSKSYNSRRTPAYKMTVRLSTKLEKNISAMLEEIKRENSTANLHMSKRRKVSDGTLQSFKVVKRLRTTRSQLISRHSDSLPSTSGYTTARTNSSTKGPSTSSISSSHYSTRSKTGTLKPKRFKDHYTSEELGNLAQISTRRLLQSSDESEKENHSLDRKSKFQRNGRRVKRVVDSESDYTKETDAEDAQESGVSNTMSHNGSEKAVADTQLDACFSEETDFNLSDEETIHKLKILSQKSKKRPFKSVGKYSTRYSSAVGERTGGSSNSHSTGVRNLKNGYVTRHQTQHTVGMYRESYSDSDSEPHNNQHLFLRKGAKRRKRLRQD